MTLYSYIVRFDTGFAPNPFFGYCTLACCKAGIRKAAKAKDWIIGLTPRAQGKGNKIVYFMQVDETLTFDAYWRDPRFKEKRPNLHGGPVEKNGDNIYKPSRQHSLGYLQLPSDHSDQHCKMRENAGSKDKDLGGGRVLVSRRFAYFGSNAMDLPKELKALRVERNYRCQFSAKVKEDFLHFAKKQKVGAYEAPRHWPKDDHTWKVAASGKV
ncbi:MAG: hypothetical protein WAN37_16420 [Bryobacteraceae bacterium]